MKHTYLNRMFESNGIGNISTESQKQGVFDEYG